MNKIQQLAETKIQITKVQRFREKLSDYGVSSGMAWQIWTHGATSKHDYYIIHALEQILFTPAIEILNDPENLIPKKGK